MAAAKKKPASATVRGHQKDLAKIAGTVAGIRAFKKMEKARAEKGKPMRTAKLSKVVSTVSTARKKAEKQTRKSFK